LQQTDRFGLLDIKHTLAAHICMITVNRTMLRAFNKQSTLQHFSNHILKIIDYQACVKYLNKVALFVKDKQIIMGRQIMKLILPSMRHTREKI